MKESIFLYHTNDLHSYFGNWSHVATYLKEQRELRAKHNEISFTVDIGDHMDRVHPISEATMGKANIALMNDLQYDLVTIGNNEGITISHDQLYHLYDDALFDVVCSNLTCLKRERPLWLTDVKIMTTPKNVSIGFIGLTAPFNPYYNLLNWHIDDPFDTLEKLIPQIKSQVDIIVLLSHLGIYEDQKIAQTFSDIDVIIGGHTHHLLRTGETIHETLLTACGKHCEFVGEIELVWDIKNKRLIKKVASVTNVTELPKDLTTEQRLEELAKEAAFILNKEVNYLNQSLKVNWFSETDIMKHFTNTLLHWTKADCAMLNAGLLLDELPAGSVTYGDIHRICPHPINPCVVRITGKELVSLLQTCISKEFIELKLKGFGFRGEVLGTMVYAGLEFTIIQNDNSSYEVKDIYVQTEKLDNFRDYLVATGDLFTFGRLLPEIANASYRELFMPEFMRDILVKTLLKFPKSKDNISSDD